MYIYIYMGLFFFIYALEVPEELSLLPEGWTLHWYRRRENVNVFLFKLELDIWSFSDSR